MEINPRFNGAKGATNKIGKLAGLASQDFLFSEWAYDRISPMAINPRPKKYARWVAIYNQKNEFQNLSSYCESISISNATDLKSKTSLTFLDINQLVLIASEQENDIENHTHHLISSDVI